MLKSITTERERERVRVRDETLREREKERVRQISRIQGAIEGSSRSRVYVYDVPTPIPKTRVGFDITTPEGLIVSSFGISKTASYTLQIS